MHIFYAPNIDDSNEYTLSEEESKHCVRVLRLKTGDTIRIIDGKGGQYQAQIKDDSAKKCTVEITETKKNVGKKDFHLHIAIAPTKNIERLEWFLEKATEIGIDEITPLICEHSERTVIKTERLNKVLIAAMKQSYKAYLPKLNEATKFSDLIQEPFTGQKFISHCRTVKYNENGNKDHYLKNVYSAGNDVLILIGPEGDFSEQEIKTANDKGCHDAILSDSRLRTETAGIVACQVINFINS